MGGEINRVESGRETTPTGRRLDSAETVDVSLLSIVTSLNGMSIEVAIIISIQRKNLWEGLSIGAAIIISIQKSNQLEGLSMGLANIFNIQRRKLQNPEIPMLSIWMQRQEGIGKKAVILSIRIQKQDAMHKKAAYLSTKTRNQEATGTRVGIRSTRMQNQNQNHSLFHIISIDLLEPNVPIPGNIVMKIDTTRINANPVAAEAALAHTEAQPLHENVINANKAFHAPPDAETPTLTMILIPLRTIVANLKTIAVAEELEGVATARRGTDATKAESRTITTNPTTKNLDTRNLIQDLEDAEILPHRQ